MNWFKKFWKALNEPTPTAPAPTTTKVTVKAGHGESGEDSSSFTPHAQQVLALSRKEADRFNHNFVGTEHLLLGLIALGQGVAVNVLHKMGLDLMTIRVEVEKQVGKGPDQKMIGNIPYTPRVKKVIALAQKEAKSMNHTYVGTEHILLGLLREGDGVAAKILRALDVNIEQCRKEILKELDPNHDPSSADALKDSTRETIASQPRFEKAQEPLPAHDTRVEVMGNFTPRAQQVLALGREEVNRLHHNYFSTEHLLLGLIKLEQGVAFNVLAKQGLNLETVRQEVEKEAGKGPEQKVIGNVPYAPRLRKAVVLAQGERQRLNHTYLGTEHLLLGLLCEGNGVAAKVFRNLGVDLDKTYTEILKELDPNFASGSTQALKDSTKETSAIQSLPHPQPVSQHPGSVDVNKRYDVYCAEHGGEPVVYRNARFKGIKKLFRDFMTQFIESELEDGQTIFVSPHSVIKFCEPGVKL